MIGCKLWFGRLNSNNNVVTNQKRGYKSHFKQIIEADEKRKSNLVSTPSTPKLASTVIICREREKEEYSSPTFNYELLLVKRRKEARFMPNFYVFPGGLVEKSDFLPTDSPLFHEINEELKTDDLKRALRVAAIREVFEESNIFLSDERFNVSPSILSTWKERVLSNPNEFINMCVELKTKVKLNGLYEWAHWITPEFEKYRYDTFFYLIPVSYTESLVSENDEKEIVDHEWIQPDIAIDRHLRGDLKLAPPTWITISELLKYKNISSLIEIGRSGRNMTPILPEFLVLNEDKMHLCLPGDENSTTRIGGAKHHVIIEPSKIAPYTMVNQNIPPSLPYHDL